MRDGDLAAVAAIAAQTLLSHVRDSGGDPSLVTEDFLRSTLAQSRLLVAEAAGRVVGFLQYQSQPPDLVVNGAALLPCWQRQGLGERMFAEAVHRARAEGCRTVVISVQPTNVDVHRLYVRLGFTEGANPSGWNQELHRSMDEVLELLESRSRRSRGAAP